VTLTDERSPSAHRPHPWLLAVVTVVVLAAAAWAAIVVSSSDDSGPGEKAVATGSAARDSAALDRISLPVVQSQQNALSTGDRRAFMSTWAADADSQSTARLIFANLRRLGAEINLRWIEAAPAVTGTDSAGPWEGEVDATWHLPDIDNAPASTELTYTFHPDEAGGARVVDVQVAAGDREPIWLAQQPLQVRRGTGWLVAASTVSDASRLGRRIPAVVRHVRDIVGTGTGGFAVYAPASSDVLYAVAAAPSGQFDGIAGVTVSVDGSRRRQAPVAVMLNPDVYDRLDHRGRTVVLAHEVTHAVTGASTVAMPLWLAEGFADYVAISAVEAPIGVSARLALRAALRDGLPTQLPTQAVFSQSGRRLEVAYEQSWLVVRSIARHYGESDLLSFYRRVVTEPGRVRVAAREELGVGLDDLILQWRADMRSLLDA
jgi:hypothetical protein